MNLDQIKTFIESQDTSSLQGIEDFGVMPFPAIGLLLSTLNSKVPLANKRLLDFGCGDLRISLVADEVYGMKVVAVDINPIVSNVAETILNNAKAQGVGNDITLFKAEDAFDRSWSPIDLVIFFYVEPSEADERESFRRKFIEKLQETNNGYLALVFTASSFFQDGVLVTDVNPQALKIPKLKTVGKAIRLSDEFDGIYLQIYKK